MHSASSPTGIAAITSMKECCLTAMVEKLIKTAAKATAKSAAKKTTAKKPAAKKAAVKKPAGETE